MGRVRRFRPTDRSATARLTVALDLVALALFVIAGMRSHATDPQIEVFARNAVPLGGAWIVVALAVGTYRPPSLPRLLVTWAIAVPAGVALRAWWTGSPSGPDLAVFGAVALAFTLAFLAGGRLVVSLLAGRLARREGREPDPDRVTSRVPAAGSDRRERPSGAPVENGRQ